jgi:3-oxoacyl-[acyl-carrier protein] reductase
MTDAANDFRSRIVVITGATGVYGRQFAARFASLGSKLFLTDRDATALASLAAEFTDADAVETFAADLTSEQELLALSEAVATRLGAPDTVILNAGIYPFGGLFDTSIETFDRIFDVNVRANFVLTQRLARMMIDAGKRGNLIFIGSAAAHILRSNGLAYCTSKRALEWFMKGVALELAPHGIRVNLIEPGLALGSAGTDFPEGYVKAIEKQIPMGRLIAAGEAADAAVFLASEAAAYVTGASVPVDGGGSIPRRAQVS